MDMTVAPQLVIFTEKSPFLSTYTPTIFLASAPAASAEATRHRSARNTGALAIGLARRKKTTAQKMPVLNRSECATAYLNGWAVYQLVI